MERIPYLRDKVDIVEYEMQGGTEGFKRKADLTIAFFLTIPPFSQRGK